MKPKVLKSGIKNVKFGSDVTYVKPVNLYGCELGDEVKIGPFVEIQKNVKIGKRTKVQSHSMICEWVNIGNDCFIGHGVMFINDPFLQGGPAKGDRTLWRKTNIGNNVSIGSNASILPINICDDTVIGAGAVVTKDITEPGVYVGNPARKLK